MKTSLTLIIIGLLIASCNPKIEQKTVLGSWYYFNKTGDEYREIHIDDSLLVYIYDNADILVSFDYKMINDTLYLGTDLDSIVKKYQVAHINCTNRKMLLKGDYEKLVLIKMDTIIQNLNARLKTYDGLDSFSYYYYKRKMIFLDEHDK